MDVSSRPGPSLTARLLLEALVVIGSILAAFAIDAWWDGRGDRQAERALLARLQADLATLRPELESVEAEHRERRDACVALLEMLSVGDVLPTTPEVDRLVAWAFIGARTFRPGSGAAEAFLSGDGSRLVRNQRLADLLLTWPGLVEELQEEESNLERGAAERWVPYLAARTSLAPFLATFEDRVPSIALLPRRHAAPTRRASVRVDQGFLNQIVERFQFQTLAIRDVQPVRDALNEMLALLEEELGSD